MLILSSLQTTYVKLRLAGVNATEAARQAGYRSPRTDGWKLERSKKIILALSTGKLPAQSTAVTVPSSQQSVYIPPELPIIVPLSREEAQSMLTLVVRDRELPLQSRLVALKIFADMLHWEREGSTTATILLGACEKTL
jgi:hypothetical protein